MRILVNKCQDHQQTLVHFLYINHKHSTRAALLVGVKSRSRPLKGLLHDLFFPPHTAVNCAVAAVSKLAQLAVSSEISGG